jgi:hypothetical protein
MTAMMTLTPETPAAELIEWLDDRNLTATPYHGGDPCPCCGGTVDDGRVLVALYRSQGKGRALMSAGCGSDLTSAYADAITRYERLY